MKGMKPYRLDKVMRLSNKLIRWGKKKATPGEFYMACKLTCLFFEKAYGFGVLPEEMEAIAKEYDLEYE